MLRALTEADIPEIQELFRNTVLNVNIRDYTEEEVNDWASCMEDENVVKELLDANCFIAAIDGNSKIIGFSSMNEEGYMHSMFVHKDWQGRGVATQLLSEVENKAREYGVSVITSDVSLTARTFFERNGYEVIRIQRQRANRLEMANFLMKKALLLLDPAQVTFRCPGMSPGTEPEPGSERRMQPSVTRATF